MKNNELIECPKREFEEYKKENELLRIQLRDKDRRIESLEKENSELRKELDKIKTSAPFLAASDKTAEAGGIPSSGTFYRRKTPETERKKTGGQPGHKGHGRKRPEPNTPSVIIPLEKCPYCDTKVNEPIESAAQSRTITDIPVPTHIVYMIMKEGYWCSTCKKIVRGNATWLPPHQEYGPGVASWLAFQRMLGLSIERAQLSLVQTYAIWMSQDRILKLEKWVADTLREEYKEIHSEIVASQAVNADETRFRINGENGWMWVFVSLMASLYRIAPTRGHQVPEEILEGFMGVLGRDAWRPYDCILCNAHQLDLIHVNRWLERAEIKHGIEPRTILSSQNADFWKIGKRPEEFIEFVDTVRSILKRSVKYSEIEPSPSQEDRTQMAKQFKAELELILNKVSNDADIVRISKTLRERIDMLFTFVDHEGVPWHNNSAELGIRKGVLHRKNSGGRRTWTGAEVLEILLSVYETVKKRGGNFMDLILEKFYSNSDESHASIASLSRT